MKKIFILSLWFTLLALSNNVHAATHYHSFESLIVYDGILLEDFESEDYKAYYAHVNKRKYFGWRVHQVHKSIKVSYVTETLFSYYNDGITPIDYKYKLETKSSSKFSISATGSIGTKNGKDGKGFKNNLDGSLKLSSEYQSQGETKETIEIALKVDPGTQVDLYIYGEGKITNGVAARYAFWFRMERGGFEVFLITTQYQRLEKKRI